MHVVPALDELEHRELPLGLRAERATIEQLALEGRTEAFERLVVEMYARGLSTRDIEDALRDEASGKL